MITWNILEESTKFYSNFWKIGKVHRNLISKVIMTSQENILPDLSGKIHFHNASNIQKAFFSWRFQKKSINRKDQKIVKKLAIHYDFRLLKLLNKHWTTLGNTNKR